MTTTRRRSSVGSAAAASAAGDPPAASTPTTVRSSSSSSRRRTSAAARRSSPGGLDLGLLGRPSLGADGGGGGGGDSTPNSVGGASRAVRAFRFFEEGEEEGGVLVLGGWRVRPLHVMASLFLLVLFAVLTLLTLYPGVSEGLSKDLSFTGPKRVGGGPRGNVTMDEIAARVGSPEVMALLEDYVERQLERVEKDKDEMREDVDGLMSIVTEIRSLQAQGALAPGAGAEAGGVVGAADREAFLGEVEGLKAQVRGLEEMVQRALKGGAGLGEEELAALKGLDVQGTVAAVAEMKERVEELDAHRTALEQRLWQQAEAAVAAASKQPAEGLGEACEEKLGELHTRVEALQGLVQGQAPARVLVEEARTIRAAVEGEVAGLKQALVALAASSSSSSSAGGGPSTGGDGVDLNAVRAAVAEAAAAAQTQLEAKETMEALLVEAREAVARLEEANTAAAAALGAGGAAGGGVGKERLGELEAELARVKEAEAALAAQVAAQEGRVSKAVEEVQVAMARQRAEAEAAAAAAAQQQQQGPALDQDAIEAMVEAEVEKHVAPLVSAFANATAAATAAAASVGGTAALDEKEVKALVQDIFQERALQEAGYGNEDVASARMGARVVTGLCSATYTPPTQLFPSDWYERLGYAGQISPRAVVISDGALNHKRAGQCWAFPGGSGTFSVELPQAVVPTAVILEHIASPLTLYPDSAPRRFAVFGRASTRDLDPVKLHSAELFTYDLNRADTPTGASQRFALDYAGAPVRVVTLEVVDNWGHEPYTCLYRFRVFVEKGAGAKGVGGRGRERGGRGGGDPDVRFYSMDSGVRVIV